jgi:hypothetical protein
LANLGPYWDVVAVDTFQGQTSNPSAQTQLTNAKRAGLTTGGYVFLNFTGIGCALAKGFAGCSGANQMRTAIASIGTYPTSNLAFLAIDVEKNCNPVTKTCAFNWNPSVSSATVDKVIADAIVAAPPAVPIVIYSNVDSWGTMTGLTGANNVFSRCPLWNANFDNMDDLAEIQGLTNGNPNGTYVFFKPYGNWNNRLAKRYEEDTGTSKGLDVAALESYSGIEYLDLDIFDWSLFAEGPPSCIGGQTFAAVEQPFFLGIPNR